MKTQYVKVYPGYWHHDRCVGQYTLVRGGYYRRPKTMNERRQNVGAMTDGYKVRGRRRKLPSNWDDYNHSFLYKKCWKRFTKQRKQWSK